MPFLRKDVRVEQLNGGVWELLDPVAYRDERGTYEVPAGYLTDFASVPRFVWWLVPTSGDYNAAAIVHDWLITDWLPAGAITSSDVDTTFREALKALGVSTPRRWLMWAGVRLGAIGNGDRRPGSLKTFPAVLGISLLALPVVLPAAVGVLISSVVSFVYRLLLPK